MILPCADCIFNTFNNTFYPLMFLERSSSAAFEDCEISDITNPEVNGTAIRAGTTSFLESSVKLEGCTLRNVTAPFFSVNSPGQGAFYSDTPRLLVYERSGNETKAVPGLPASGQSTGAPFLLADDRPPQPVAPVRPSLLHTRLPSNNLTCMFTQDLPYLSLLMCTLCSCKPLSKRPGEWQPLAVLFIVQHSDHRTDGGFANLWDCFSALIHRILEGCEVHCAPSPRALDASLCPSLSMPCLASQHGTFERVPQPP